MWGANAMATLETVFGVKTPEPIPVEQACPIGNGSNVEPDPDFVFDKNTIKRVFNNLRIQKPIWAHGPSGCGKTELFRQIGARLARRVHVISFGEETSLRELLGTFDLVPEQGSTRTRYRYGQLARAIRDPMAIVVLDEFNMAPPGVAAQFNRLLEARELVIPETGEVIRAADGVCLVATANTTGGLDETGIYAGSQVQNGATRNRFAGLRMSYLPEASEIKLLRKIKSVDGKGVDDVCQFSKPATAVMVQVATACRALVDQGDVSLPFSTRTLRHWAVSTLMNVSLGLGFQDAYLDMLPMAEAVPVQEIYKKATGFDPITGQSVSRS